MTTARLHIIRRLMLGIRGTVDAIVAEIEAELRLRGWRCEQSAQATTENRRSA